MVGVGELAGHVQLLARDSRLRDGPAHAPLGAVGLSGVEVAVSGLQRLADHSCGEHCVAVAVLPVGLDGEGVVADLRDRGAVAESDRRGGHTVVGHAGRASLVSCAAGVQDRQFWSGAGSTRTVAARVPAETMGGRKGLPEYFLEYASSIWSFSSGSSIGVKVTSYSTPPSLKRPAPCCSAERCQREEVPP